MVISLETAWGVEDMYRRELKKKKKATGESHVIQMFRKQI